MILLACAGYASSGIVLRYKFAGHPARVGDVLGDGAGDADRCCRWRCAAPRTRRPTAARCWRRSLSASVPTGLAFLGFAVLNSRVGPARASIVAYVAPIFAVALGVLFLGESVGPGTLAGLVLILGGSRLATGSR